MQDHLHLVKQSVLSLDNSHLAIKIILGGCMWNCDDNVNSEGIQVTIFLYYILSLLSS